MSSGDSYILVAGTQQENLTKYANSQVEIRGRIVPGGSSSMTGSGGTGSGTGTGSSTGSGTGSATGSGTGSSSSSTGSQSSSMSSAKTLQVTSVRQLSSTCSSN
jgi:hypothetical protein